MKQTILTAFVFCLLAASTASAQTYTYKLNDAPVFTVDIPEGWKFSTKPSQRDPTVQRFSGTAPTGLAWCGVWVVKDAKTIDEAVTYLTTTAKSLITDAKDTKQPYNGEINGMKARHFELTGTMKMQNGKNQKFDARSVLFESGGDRIGTAVCMTDAEGLTAQKGQIDAFFASLKPVR